MRWGWVPTSESWKTLIVILAEEDPWSKPVQGSNHIIIISLEKWLLTSTTLKHDRGQRALARAPPSEMSQPSKTKKTTREKRPSPPITRQIEAQFQPSDSIPIEETEPTRTEPNRFKPELQLPIPTCKPTKSRAPTNHTGTVNDGENHATV